MNRLISDLTVLNMLFRHVKLLIIVALSFAASSIVTAATSQSHIFIIARFLGGIAVGATSVLVPMYIAELTAPRNRGMFVSVYQLAIVTGILTSYIVNFGLHDLDNNMLFIAFFAACIGPVFWTLVSEIFPTRVRGISVAFISFTQWIFNFLVVLFFPHFLSLIGGAGTFLFLAAMSFLQLIFTWLYLPESKGKSLEKIEKYWKTKQIF